MAKSKTVTVHNYDIEDRTNQPLGGGCLTPEEHFDGVIVDGIHYLVNEQDFYIAAENNGTGTYRNSPRKHIIDTMGTGLTDTQAFNLSNSVQKFVTTLNKI